MKFTTQGKFMTADVKGDGNCFYRSVLIALALEGKGFYGDNHHLLLRRATVHQEMDTMTLVCAEDLCGSADNWVKVMEEDRSWADQASVQMCSVLLGIRIQVHVASDVMQDSNVLEYNRDGASRATINLLLTNHHYSVIVEEVAEDSYTRICSEQYCSDARTGDDFAEDLQMWKGIADTGRADFGSLAPSNAPTSSDALLAELLGEMDISSSAPTSSDALLAELLGEMESSDALLAEFLNDEYCNSEARCLSDSDYAFNLQVSML
jgi:hypothetical protein